MNVHFYVVLKYMGLMKVVDLRKKKREDDEKRIELGVDGSL